jgi:hypothetical protein
MAPRSFEEPSGERPDTDPPFEAGLAARLLRQSGLREGAVRCETVAQCDGVPEVERDAVAGKKLSDAFVIQCGHCHQQVTGGGQNAS